jgi:hypothetical protein
MANGGEMPFYLEAPPEYETDPSSPHQMMLSYFSGP